MLDDIFYWLLSMSITATVGGVIVMLIRAITQIPRRVSVILWLAPFLRMCVPLGVNGKHSVMSLLSKITSKTPVIYQPNENVPFSMMNCVLAADKYFPIVYKADKLRNLFEIASVIWLIGFVIITVIFGVLYFSSLREVKDAKCTDDGIYYSEKVISPAVYGIIKPRIVLPTSLWGKDTKYILLHENAHIKRHDNLWRILGFVAAFAHWFNPFAWVFLKSFLCDLELACDEQVASRIGERERKEYAYCLLESRQVATSLVSAFGGACLKMRIKGILSFKKLTLIALAFSLALVISVFYVLLTNSN